MNFRTVMEFPLPTIQDIKDLLRTYTKDCISYDFEVNTDNQFIGIFEKKDAVYRLIINVFPSAYLVTIKMLDK